MSDNSLHDGKEIFVRTARIFRLGERPSRDCISSVETKGEPAPDFRWSLGLHGANFGAGNVSSANDFVLASLRQVAYPPPRFACVIGAARALVAKA